MIITVTPNPAVDKSIIVTNFKVDSVNRVQSIRLDAGGKGINVSKVINAMGEKSVAMGIVGGDTGKFVLSQISDMGIETDFVTGDFQTRTNLKIFDKTKKTYTDINEPGDNVGQDVFNQLYEALLNRANEGDIVVLAGRATADIGDGEFAKWATELKKKGVKVIVDMDGDRLKKSIDACPYAIKPNEFEFKEIFKLRDVEISTLAKKALELSQGKVDLVVVSMGARGSLFIQGNKCVMASSERVEAISTVGAGDSVTAGIAIALQNSYDLKELARFATAIGTATVMCEGSSPPSKEKVDFYMKKIKVEEIKAQNILWNLL